MDINVTLLGGEQSRSLTLSGRIGQTIYHLWQAGPSGITAFETPALRLAAYVHSLREMGFAIETAMETHEGRYAGRHARYRLLSAIEIQQRNGEGGMMERQIEAPRLASMSAPVRRIMRRHGLSEPSARSLALLVYGAV